MMCKAVPNLCSCIFAMLILPGIGAQVGKGSPPGKAPRLPVELVLSPDRVTVTPNSDLELSIEWINQSRNALQCDFPETRSGIDERYEYEIRRSDGQPVSRIPGKEKEKNRDFSWSGADYCRLMPGASEGFVVSGLMKAFEMNRPGEYTVQVSLPDPDRPGQILGRSNAVTVTVIASQ